MGLDVDRAVAELASRQYGVFSRAQGRSLGVTESMVRTRLATGRWDRVHASVLRIAGMPQTWEAVLMAACLAPSAAVASHRSAAWLRRLDGSRKGTPEITVPRGKRLRLAGVIVHESGDFDLREEGLIDGIPTTGLARTVLDLGAVLRPARVGQTVDHVLRTGQLDVERLWDVRARHKRRGRRGNGVLREVLEERTGQGVPDSFFERLVHSLLVDAGLPEPVMQFTVLDGRRRFVARLDLSYPDLQIAIELLGKQFHFTEQAFERDPARRNRLELLGWTVLEFTWRQYVDDPGGLCRDVADAIRRRTAAATG